VANELDPQVEVLLEQIQAKAALAPPASAFLSAKEKIIATRQLRSSNTTLRYPLEPVSKTENFDIPGPAGRVPVRLYVPYLEGSMSITAPVFVYFHGGGFVAGDLEEDDTLLRALANRAQCIVMSVAYRLAPEDPYPAANDDAWVALTWVADHASKIGADSKRIAIGGASSGGLLAAWVAQKAAKSGPALRLQVLLYPILDVTASKHSWKELGTGSYLVSHTKTLEWYDAYLPPGINREDPKVSPLFATDLIGVAPALIITADHDPVRDEGNEYASKLKAANILVDHTCWTGMIHGFASMAGVLDAGKVLIDRTGAALKRAFE